ncbi:MAG: hypothetical protein ACUVXJ_15635 [Phycisphaerae bacterium]
MPSKNALVERLLFVGCLVVVVGRPCPAQATRPSTPAPAFVPAIEGQKRVLAELNRILQEEKVMLSDGAVQLALETLLSDEQKQAEGIRELGKRTLGRTAEELNAENRAERDRLSDGQDTLTDRYRRLEKGMENKATIKPDSVYTGLLAKATDSQLLQTMEDAGRQVRANQLSNALRSTNKVIKVLREMVAMASQKAGGTQDMDNTTGDGGFMAPSLRYKGLLGSWPSSIGSVRPPTRWDTFFAACGSWRN